MIGNGFKLISQNIFLRNLNNHSSFNTILWKISCVRSNFEKSLRGVDAL
jgi:hypothetical protein